MTILVTGSSGFLGSRLMKRLIENGKDVMAVGRRPPPPELKSHPRVEWLMLDIARDNFDPTRLQDIEAVVHLAGATLGASKDEALFLRANEVTTVRLFQALAKRTNRFIFASSQVVYGDACHIGVTEDFPLQPDGSAYACSKLNSENWLRWFQKQNGGNYLALRFCGFINGGGIVDYLIDQALSGDVIELYSRGVVRRDYLSSVDAVDVLVASLNCPLEPGFLPLNIGSGQAVSAHDLAMLVCEEVSSTSRIELIDTASPQGDFVFCIDRARQILDFNPSCLSDAVREYARQKKRELSENHKKN